MDNDPHRLVLHSILVGNFPTIPIYFRPPSTLLLTYPCIVYDVTSYKTQHANDRVYTVGTSFKISLLSNLPGSSQKSALLRVPGIKHVTSFTKNDIVNDIFNINVT